MSDNTNYLTTGGSDGGNDSNTGTNYTSTGTNYTSAGSNYTSTGGNYTSVSGETGDELGSSTSSLMGTTSSSSVLDSSALALLSEQLTQQILELEGPRREVGPQTVQVRPVCGRSGGGPQRLVARRPRFVTYELNEDFRGENVVAMWHTYMNDSHAKSGDRFRWASLAEAPDVTVSVRYLRGPDSLGEVPAEERDLFDRERYRVEVRPGQPDPRYDVRHTDGPRAKTRTLLYYRGEPMDTRDGEHGMYIFVMSEEGDLYAGNPIQENLKEGPGAYLQALEAAAEALLAEGWNFRAAKRVPPTDRLRPAPDQPATCGLQAVDQDGGCEGRVSGPEDAHFIPGVTTSSTAPTGFEPANGVEGVAYFADLPEGGAWVCKNCYDRRGRETHAVRWPVIVRPAINLAEVRQWIESRHLEEKYPCVLDAIDAFKGSARRAASELRSAAAQRVAQESGGSPRRMLLLHHTSFLAGAPVACAGRLKVKDGVLEKVDNNSGHYAPPRPLLLQAIARLAELGVDVYSLGVGYMVNNNERTVTVSKDWATLRAAMGSVDDPVAMERAKSRLGPDRLAWLRRDLNGGIQKVRRGGRFYARRPDAASAPCATSGCAEDATCVAIDKVGETFLCRSCLDVRLLGRCERPGCQEPSTHEVLATDLEGAWERGGRERNRNAAGKLAKEGDVDVQVRVGLCTQHFRERLTIRCSETGCTRTSEQGVMDAISNSFFCKEHFAAGMEAMGLRVCQDPDCTETQEVAQVGDRWLCRDHRA